MEYLMLETIEMRVDSPTLFTCLNRYLYKSFPEQHSDLTLLELIKKTSVYVLKMCLHESSFLSFQCHILAISVLVVSLKFYFESLRTEKQIPQRFELLKQEEAEMVTHSHSDFFFLIDYSIVWMFWTNSNIYLCWNVAQISRMLRFIRVEEHAIVSQCMNAVKEISLTFKEKFPLM